MYLIIAGSRNFHDLSTLEAAIAEFNLKPEVIIHGAARGVDTLAQLYAEKHGIPVVQFPANWDKYGLEAGPIRNCLMAERGDALLALWNKKSRGTKHMIQTAVKRGLPVHVKYIDCA